MSASLPVINAADEGRSSGRVCIARTGNDMKQLRKLCRVTRVKASGEHISTILSWRGSDLTSDKAVLPLLLSRIGTLYVFDLAIESIISISAHEL
jgi:hypothetical protein